MLLVLGGAVGSMILGLHAPDGSVLLPLTALQVLWINFLGDGPPALALAADRSPGVLKQPPRPRATPLLDSASLRFILADGFFKGATGLALLVLLPRFGATQPETAAAVFLYESAAKLVSVYPARRVGVAPSINPWLHLSVACGIAIAALCVFFEPLRRLLAFAPFDVHTAWLLVLAVLVTGIGGEVVARRQNLRARR
jgi:Ca2+-transporting ATPase